MNQQFNSIEIKHLPHEESLFLATEQIMHHSAPRLLAPAFLFYASLKSLPQQLAIFLQ
ncbi:hypothetical protein LINPERPRIM_LOCUS5932 [Linum perenne]